MKELVDGLRSRDNQYAYQCMKQLEAESAGSNSAYLYFDTFVEMLEDANSYVRTRGIVLIAVNAKWDMENKLDEIIDDFVKHIMDEKPITARQCIKMLPLIAESKPDLKNFIYYTLQKANPLIYKSSMQSLVNQDIENALERIGKLGG